MQVYLVVFHTGEWEGYHQLLLRIYNNLPAAEKYANQLRSKLDSIGRHSSGNNSASDNQNTRYDDAYLIEDNEDTAIGYNGAWITVSSPYQVYTQ